MKLKKFLSVFIVSSLICSFLSFVNVSAVTTTCTTYSGKNVNSQSYNNYSSTVKSYLTECSDGSLMRVQANAVSGKILVEYYDSEYNLKSTKLVDSELSVFGGFYSTDTNYYILSGQTNYNEDDSVEVYRITKYDTDWNRISSCGLYGENTYIPFDAGTARMTSSGNYLLIRTCHEMYASSDGKHHQANVTIQVDMNTMTVTDKYSGVMNSGYGYVSHSFNQFIKTDGTSIVGVDHGDAYPRSAVLIKYNTDFTTGKFVPGYSSKCSVIDMIEFTGNIGANYTGANIGGFEISDTSYIVAGNTVDQNDFSNSKTRNIFVSVSPRDLSSSPNLSMITNYQEGEASASAPHLVKISNKQFVLMWTQNNTIYYVMLNSSGEKSSNVYSMTGELSDCAPVLLSNGKIIWYVWDNEQIDFYSINASDLSQNDKTEIKNGHKYVTIQEATSESNIVIQKCSVCEHEKTFTVPNSVTPWWRLNADSGSYWSYISKSLTEGDTVDLLFSTSPSNVDSSEVLIISSDPNVMSVNSNRITALNAGTAEITIQPKYNSSAAKKFTFTVSHEFEDTVVAPTYSEDGYTLHTCVHCGYSYKDNYVDRYKTQLVGKVFYQTRSSGTEIRFIAEVDEQDIINAENGKYSVSLNNDETNTQEVTTAYYSFYSNGKLISAPEGKCYIITHAYGNVGTGDTLEAEFSLNSYESGLSRTVTLG